MQFQDGERFSRERKRFLYLLSTRVLRQHPTNTQTITQTTPLLHGPPYPTLSPVPFLTLPTPTPRRPGSSTVEGTHDDLHQDGHKDQEGGATHPGGGANSVQRRQDEPVVSEDQRQGGGEQTPATEHPLAHAGKGKGKRIEERGRKEKRVEERGRKEKKVEEGGRKEKRVKERGRKEKGVEGRYGKRESGDEEKKQEGEKGEGEMRKGRKGEKRKKGDAEKKGKER